MPGIPTLIKGSVKNAAGVGIDSAAVKGVLGTGSFTTTTAADGSYFASWVGTGTIIITATKTGYQTTSVSCPITKQGGTVTAPTIVMPV
jgi:hypothetical protein